MENLEIPGRIQRERFTLVDFFRKKSNTFRGITFFPLSPKRPKFSVPFVGITSARRQVERKRKIYRYFVNGTIQARSRFRFQKKYQYLQNGKCHLSENGPRIFFNWARTRGMCLLSGGRGDSHMKKAGMLVVSLRGVNFRFWSHLGCSGQNAIIFSR